MTRSASQSHKATIFIAASEIDSNLYYATKFIAPDPFIYLEIKGERLLVMNDLEMDRAKSQAKVDRVLSYSEIERRAGDHGYHPCRVAGREDQARACAGEFSVQPCQSAPGTGISGAREAGPVLRA